MRIWKVVFAAVALSSWSLAGTAQAQIKDDPRGELGSSQFDVNWSKGDAPLAGESREDAVKRFLTFTPDPQKYPVPRTPWDNKPYFGGVWWPSDAIVKRPPVPLESLYRKGPEITARRESEELANWKNGFSRPMFNCISSRMVSANTGGLLSTQIIHGPGVFSTFVEAGSPRIATIDAKARPTGRKPSYMGDAVGHWEGDTLVIETTNFKDGLWLNGGPQGKNPPQTASDALKVVERWTYPDGRFAEFQVTIYDDKMLTAPWVGPLIRMGRTENDAVIEMQPCFEDPTLVKMEQDYQEKVKAGKLDPGHGDRERAEPADR